MSSIKTSSLPEKEKNLLRKKFLCDPLEGRVTPLNKKCLRSEGWREEKKKIEQHQEGFRIGARRWIPTVGDEEEHLSHVSWCQRGHEGVRGNSSLWVLC